MCVIERISNVWLKVSIFAVYNNYHLVVGGWIENVLVIEVHHTRAIDQVRVQQLYLPLQQVKGQLAVFNLVPESGGPLI